MAKLVHQEGEAAKLSVRAARHKALERAKKALTARGKQDLQDWIAQDCWIAREYRTAPDCAAPQAEV